MFSKLTSIKEALLFWCPRLPPDYLKRLPRVPQLNTLNLSSAQVHQRSSVASTWALSWGFAFLVLDFQNGLIDLFFPDLLGYLLILIGLIQISRPSLQFRVPTILAGILIIVSLLDVFITRTAILNWFAQQGYGIQIGGGIPSSYLGLKANPYWFIPVFSITLLGTVLDLMLVGMTCHTLIEWAKRRKNSYLEKLIRVNWKLYFAFTIAVFLFYIAPAFIVMITGEY